MAPEERNSLEKIVTTQRNIKIYGGVAVGILLLIYFFTFPHILDRLSFGFFMVETAVAVALLATFFIGNRVSFALTKMIKLGQRNRVLLRHMRPRDVLMDLQELETEIERRRAA